jgi:hypothetical protein
VKTVDIPTTDDLTAAASERYTKRRQKLIDSGNTDAGITPPEWDDLPDSERNDQVNQMRAAFVAGPHVAKALGLRIYSQSVTVPEPGQTVLYRGWPALVTMTRGSAEQHAEPFHAQTALPSLRDELSVHLHVFSALGPYPAYAVSHGIDGWQWPQEIEAQRQADEERKEARLRGA